MNRRRVLAVLVVLVVLAVTGYLAWVSGGTTNGPLILSGTIEADEVRVGPELTGRIVEIRVAKGDAVQAGDVLFRLDDTLLRAQLDQARAVLDEARTQQALAEAQYNVAKLQYEQVLRQARLTEAQTRTQPWTTKRPNDFNLPMWYFTKAERLQAAQAEVDEACKAYQDELANLQDLQKTIGGQAFVEVETRLAQARAQYENTKALLDLAKAAQDKTQLQDYAQKLFDEALNALQSAQTEYDRLLTTQAAKDILEARARVAVARERCDAAQERLYALQTGEDAIEVQLAKAQMDQAQKALDQAKAAVARAEAQVRYLEAQLEKLTVTAPIDGVVLALDAKAGEVVQAGAAVLILGDLAHLTIRVYVPEDRLGDVRLGQMADLTVDAFPGQVFPAKVVYISDKAEYTPQNVQTQERRKATVFAVELEILDTTGRLKPGMPADVTFRP